MRRWLAVALTGLAAWMSLGACYLGPDPVQYAALAVVDGRPTAVVAVCGRSTVEVHVYRHDASYDGTLHRWSVTVTPGGSVRDIEVELLGAARAGWAIAADNGQGNGTRVLPLTSFEAGHHYTLDSSELGPEGSHAPEVTFGTGDLPKIGVGQVLAPAGHDHSKVVSHDSFVRERCDQ
jgi:hypothetical protein